MLYIVATPIGNLEDITLRALRILGEADYVLAEDTRKTGLLLNRYNIKKKLVSFYEHNEIKRIPAIIRDLKEAKNIALVSNAGTPTISDPGYKLIREARRAGQSITSLAGPSSITCALSLSALAHDKFAYLGYIPRKKSQRKKLIEKIKTIHMSVVLFESPFRLLSSLKDLSQSLGECRVTIAREMTKKYEEVLELSLKEAVGHFESNSPRGEFTLIIAPCC